MDEKTKNAVLKIRQLIKKQNYKEALQQADILIYKSTKAYQVYLMAGLCNEKLGKLKQAEAAYLQVIQLKNDQVNAIKSLGQLYAKMGKNQQSTKYMQKMISIQKTSDPVKYRQSLVKLVQLYEKDLHMQKIDDVFKQLLKSQKQITEQLAAIAQIYFRTAVTNQCFFLDNFMPLGLSPTGQGYRFLLPNAKQKLNNILIQIVRYLYSVKHDYKMSNRDISTSIYQLRQCFPYASCFLMLFLLDEYIVSQAAYNAIILQQIYLLLSAFYSKADNPYLNFQTLEPEYFVVSVILSYEYLSFMKQFFILDQIFNPYYEKLAAQATQLQSRKVREEFAQKISKFILKQCRTINKISQTQNIQNRLQSLKYRILKLDGSYLQQVVAKMAMKCFVNYQKLSDMKNMLKTRINNLKDEVQPHLYKYYYDYLIKIAKLYKSLDEQLSIYDVIQYIYTHDQKDAKYLVQYQWIQVGKKSKQDQAIFNQTVKKSLINITQLLIRLTGSQKSQTIRKQTILKILLKQYDEVSDGLKLALGTDRSFENLQAIGTYYFVQKEFDRSLRFLKEAFIIRQDDYHLNRAIFIAMIKTNDQKQAYSFLQRIYEGFPNIYWVNYALAMNSINNNKIELAYNYLSAAFQAFNTGVTKSFKFSFEKTIEGDKYSIVYMVDQNNFHVLLDQIVVPEKIIYQQFPMTSSLFFDSTKQLKQIKLQTQLGQLLKILGRNKSSFNHLYSANAILQSLNEQIRLQNYMQVICTKKQYATMLFYVRAYKQSEQILKYALKVCEEHSDSKNKLLEIYQSQIRSLIFQVSVMRLDQLMKFQSYEAVQEYINKFKQDLKELKTLIKKPSLNYYKAKYQFYILCYLHNKNLGIDQSVTTIKQFLNYFKLNTEQISSDSFYNRLTQLSNQQRIIIKQCLQDYYVLLYMQQNGFKQVSAMTAQKILPLIQLFPTSSVFYIVYGMAVKQTKLKISAFLKCIQLDRESPISVDLLASLFLKQKDYLTACKLFLKSLQIDLFNPKSYIGLCTCLYVIINNSIKRGTVQDKAIIDKALNKINSYMQFLRISDPSQNYHILKFLKTLISNQPVPLFELKAGLQQSRKLTAHKYSQKLLYKLLEQSTTYLKQYNIWQEQGQEKILQLYIKNNNIQGKKQDLYAIGKSLLVLIHKQVDEFNVQSVKSREIRVKIKCKMLNKLSVAVNIFRKALQFKSQQLQKTKLLCNLLEQNEQGKDDELKKLQIATKQTILATVILSSHNDGQGKNILNTIKDLNMRTVFKKHPSFAHIQTYLDHFASQNNLNIVRKYILQSIHLCPCDPLLRKVLLSWLLVVQKQTNKSVKKIKQTIDYRLDSMIQMNSNNEADRSGRHHKKHAIMYNIQQPNAWIGFISELWQKNKDTRWIKHLIKLLKLYENKQNILSITSRNKASWMLIQMTIYELYTQNNKQAQHIIKDEKELTTNISIMNQLTSQAKNSKFTKIMKQLPQKLRIGAMQIIVSSFVSKHQHSQKLQKILNNCIQICDDLPTKGFFYLLKFSSISSQQTNSKQSLVQQLKKLINIIAQCQVQSNKDQKVHKNSLAIMKCMVALLSLNFEQLQQQLANAYECRLVTYKSQVAINYYEIMRVYRQLQQNHQGQNVFQNFTQYINMMIGFVKQPYLKGFFNSIKAMGEAIVTQQSSQKLSRQLKLSMLLSPPAGQKILNKS